MRTGSKGEGRNIWALLLGGIAVLVQYFAGPLITPGAFGFSRWMSGFVDIAGLPALVPFAVCLLLVMLRVFSSTMDCMRHTNGTRVHIPPYRKFRDIIKGMKTNRTFSPTLPEQYVDYTGFTLLWLVPSAAFYSMSSSSSLIPLVLVPILWAAQAIGISFFLRRVARNSRWYTVILSVLGIAALPIAATTSWWAFFVQRSFPGFVLLALSLIPAVISLCRRDRNRDWGIGNGE